MNDSPFDSDLVENAFLTIRSTNALLAAGLYSRQDIYKRYICLLHGGGLGPHKGIKNFGDRFETHFKNALKGVAGIGDRSANEISQWIFHRIK